MSSENGFSVPAGATAENSITENPGALQPGALPDSILIRSVCSGDIQAFSVLIGRYRKRVTALGMSFFRNTADAEDFVQDVFIKVYTSLKTFRGEAKFSTWLMRIAYNTAVNSIKRRREYLSLSDETEIIDTGEGPEAQHMRQAIQETIREAIQELPEQYNVCLDMYFYYDMSYKEISEVIHLPVNTIKSHVFRAKKILRSKLCSFMEE
ncbi:MAG: sigma-70 family RNA polymerase sigma factor [Spirochaetaceae bacterium]|jgi:RNA polymerase sigma-70 factor (ECF subfamily)|nr:sigma-70 family RNA polymerase sigma factor [Spirochaetaceae bacterium]